MVKKAVIPAAGLGTRMLPATKAVPKEMINIVDKPAIQYVVEEIAACGITDILIITGRGKGVMEDHFDYSYEVEHKLSSSNGEIVQMLRDIANLANISFIRQKEPKGLGHAVYCAKTFTGNDPFALILPDDIIKSKGKNPTAQLISGYEKIGKTILGVQKVLPDQIAKYGCILPKMVGERLMKVMDMVEKPKIEDAFSDYAALGRYILTKDIYKEIENTGVGVGGEIQLTDALRRLIPKGELYAYDFEGRRYDTGSKQGYLEAVVEYALEHEEVAESFKNYLKSLTL